MSRIRRRRGCSSHGVTLVDSQGHGLAGLAQHGGHILVGGGNAGLDVHYHDDGIRQLDADDGLAAHEFQHIVLGAGLDAAGVHQREGAVAPFAVAVDPVAGNAGGVLDDGGAVTGELIEQHGFANVGTANNGDQTFCHADHSFQYSGDGYSVFIPFNMPYFQAEINGKNVNGM